MTRAADLKPGDTIRSGEWDGWTVTGVVPNAEASFWYGDEEDGEFTSDVVVLLTLERERIVEPGTPAMIYYGPPDRHYPAVPPKTETETCRTWFRSDEEVTR